MHLNESKCALRWVSGPDLSKRKEEMNHRDTESTAKNPATERHGFSRKNTRGIPHSLHLSVCFRVFPWLKFFLSSRCPRCLGGSFLPAAQRPLVEEAVADAS